MCQPDLESDRRSIDGRVFPLQRGEIVWTEATEEDDYDDTQNPGSLDLPLPRGYGMPARHGGDLRPDAASRTQHHDKHSYVQDYDEGDGYDEGEDEVDDSRQVVDDDHALTQAGARVARFLQVVFEKYNPVEDGAEPAQIHNVLDPGVGDLGGVEERVTDGHIAVNGYEHHAGYGD